MPKSANVLEQDPRNRSCHVHVPSVRNRDLLDPVPAVAVRFDHHVILTVDVHRHGRERATPFEDRGILVADFERLVSKSLVTALDVESGQKWKVDESGNVRTKN